MAKLQSLRADALQEGPVSTGITRHMAFTGEGFQMMRARSSPGRQSGWHHHGDYEVYGFLVSGGARFESEFGKGNAIDLQPGDFFHIPPHTVHREVNPSTDTENELIIFLRGSGQSVFNVEEH